MKKIIVFVLLFISVFSLYNIDINADSNIQIGDIYTYGKESSLTDLFNDVEDDIDNMRIDYLDLYASNSEITNFEVFGELSIEWDIELYIDNSTSNYAIDGKEYINRLELIFDRVATEFINFSIITYTDSSIHGFSYQSRIFGRTWSDYGTENPKKSILYSLNTFKINETNLYITGGYDLDNPLLNELFNLITVRSETKNIITFDTNGGNTIPSLSGYITIPSLPTPERDTDIFTGWFYDIELTNRVLPNQIINNDITIYARWITNDKISNLENKAFDDGNNDGYNTGLIDGENRGYTYGYDDGYDSGYQVGVIDGSNKDIEVLEENAYHSGYYEAREVFAYKRDDEYLNYNQAFQLGSGESDKVKEIVTPLIIFMLISTVIFGAIKILGGRKE